MFPAAAMHGDYSAHAGPQCSCAVQIPAPAASPPEKSHGYKQLL